MKTLDEIGSPLATSHDVRVLTLNIVTDEFCRTTETWTTFSWAAGGPTQHLFFYCSLVSR